MQIPLKWSSLKGVIILSVSFSIWYTNISLLLEARNMNKKKSTKNTQHEFNRITIDNLSEWICLGWFRNRPTHRKVIFYEWIGMFVFSSTSRLYDEIDALSVHVWASAHRDCQKPNSNIYICLADNIDRTSAKSITQDIFMIIKIHVVPFFLQYLS